MSGNAIGSRSLNDLGDQVRCDLLGDPVNSLDCDQVTVDHVHNPELADAQTVIVTPMERLRRARVSSEVCHGSADPAHAFLIG